MAAKALRRTWARSNPRLAPKIAARTWGTRRPGVLCLSFLSSCLFRISWLAGNCPQIVDSRRLIRIHLYRKGLASIWSAFRRPNCHTIHTNHTPNYHTLHTSMTEFCHTFHTSMYQSSRSRRARRDVKDPLQVHGVGADRGKRHNSLSSR